MQTAISDFAGVAPTTPAHSFAQSQRKRILELLKNNNFVSTKQIKDVASQYNVRIRELRQEGYIIKSDKPNGVFGFVLLGFHFGKVQQ